MICVLDCLLRTPSWEGGQGCASRLPVPAPGWPRGESRGRRIAREGARRRLSELSLCCGKHRCLVTARRRKPVTGAQGTDPEEKPSIPGTSQAPVGAVLLSWAPFPGAVRGAGSGSVSEIPQHRGYKHACSSVGRGRLSGRRPSARHRAPAAGGHADRTGAGCSCCARERVRSLWPPQSSAHGLPSRVTHGHTRLHGGEGTYLSPHPF